MSQAVKVTDREGDETTIVWQEDESLMEALRDNDLPVLASCGGVRSCATCHVFVEAERYSQTGSLTDEETDLLSETDSYRSAQSRLSCQIAYAAQLQGISITIAPEE